MPAGRVSQSWYCCNFGSDSFLWWDCQCIVGYETASLASTHYILVAYQPPLTPCSIVTTSNISSFRCSLVCVCMCGRGCGGTGGNHLVEIIHNKNSVMWQNYFLICSSTFDNISLLHSIIRSNLIIRLQMMSLNWLMCTKQP